MGFVTKDMVIGTEWTDINAGDEVCILDRISGKVLFRYSDTSTSKGMSLDEKTMVDRFVQVRSVVGNATIAVSMEE